MKRLLATAAAILLLAGACGDVDELRVGPTPTCNTTSRGTLLLMAQAVPTAQAIPCIDSMPAGWEYHSADVAVGEATLVFDDPGVGDVTVELATQCDAEGTPAPSPFPGAVAMVATSAEVQSHFYVFADSCVVVESPRRLAATEMTRQISYISRDVLRQESDFDL